MKQFKRRVYQNRNYNTGLLNTKKLVVDKLHF